MFEWATKEDDVIAENVVALQAHLEAVRDPLEPIFDLVTQLYDPRLWDYMQHRRKRYSKTRRYNLAIYNMTPAEARRKFAAGFSSQTASKGDASQKSWINFVAPKAKINEDGSLGTPQKASLEDMEKAIAKTEIPQRVFIKQPIFENLKRLFGKDVEILVTY